jgi:hypothetical protein
MPRDAKHLKGRIKTICAGCVHMILDIKWEKKKVPYDLRHICNNPKSFEYEKHVIKQGNCKKHETTLTNSLTSK